MTNKENTIDKRVEEFGKQFDELGMKPPKNSMPGLERELLKDYMRKALHQTAQEERDKYKPLMIMGGKDECLFVANPLADDVDVDFEVFYKPLSHLQEKIKELKKEK